MATTAKRIALAALPYAAAFAVAALACAAALAASGVYPFGDDSMLVIDYARQYADMYRWYADVLAGRADLAYSFSGGLGSPMWATFSYYLSSPLLLLMPLFGKDGVPLYAFASSCLRVGFAAAAMLAYSRGTGLRGPCSYVPAISFALCTYMACEQQNPMWIDGVAWFPLTALGERRLSDDGRWGLLAASLAAQICVCWYTAWQSVLLLVILLPLMPGGRGLPARLRDLACAMALSLGASAWTFVPTAAAMSDAVRAHVLPFSLAILALAAAGCALLRGGMPDTGRRLPCMPHDDAVAAAVAACVIGVLAMAFSLDHELAGAFFSSDSSLNGAWLPAASCGVAAVPAACAAVSNRFRGRRAYLALAMGLLTVWCLPSALLSVPCGFRLPIGSFQRVSWMFDFALCAMSCAGLADAVPWRRAAAVCCPLCAAIVACGVVSGASDTAPCVAAMIAAAICLARGAGMPLLAVALAFSSASFANCADGVFVERSQSAYDAAFSAEERLAARLAEEDPGLYRTDRASDGMGETTRNEGLSLAQRHLTTYTSTGDRASVALLRRIGYGDGTVGGASSGYSLVYGSPFLPMDAILGVRYAASSQAQPMMGRVVEEGGLAYYENRHALPVGYEVGGDEPAIGDDAFANANAMFAWATGRAGILSEAAARTRDTGDGAIVTVSVPKGHMLYVQATRGGRPPEGPVRISCGGLSYEDDVVVGYGIHAACGASESDREVSVRVESDEDGVGLRTYVMDFAAYAAAADNAAAHRLRVDEWTGTRLSGDAATTGGDLLLTVPYDTAWRIDVDGERVIASPALGGAMTLVHMGAGDHRIEMSYSTPGLACGACVTLLAACALLMPRRR